MEGGDEVGETSCIQTHADDDQLDSSLTPEIGGDEVGETSSIQTHADDDQLDSSSTPEIGGDEVGETSSIQTHADDDQLDSSSTPGIGGDEVGEANRIQIAAGDHRQPIIQQGEQLPSKRWWSIFRVLDQHGDYGRPKIISIGPSYYKNPHFQAMETQKLKFLLRNGHRVPQLLAFKAEMKRLEKQARECYFEDFKDIPTDDFTWMMVLDACFIVVLLLNGRRYQGQLRDDPIFATHTMPFNVARDLLLLENQLPLFVLEKVFELTRREDSTSNSLTSLAVQFFEPLRPRKDLISASAANSNSNSDMVNTSTANSNSDMINASTANSTSDINTASNNYPHLLALFHSTLAPKNSQPSSTTPPERSNNIWYPRFSGGRSVPTATKLQNDGVIFLRSSGNLMEFRRWSFGGILEVPTFFLDKHTACIFRNLVAYEQHYRSATQWFTSLAIFFNNLLQTIEDVEILKNSGILRLDLMGESDEEVVSFFASVTKELVFDVERSCLLPLIKQINRYSETVVAEFNRGCRMQIGTKFIRLLVASITLVVRDRVSVLDAIEICAGDDDEPIIQQEEQVPRKQWSIFRVLDQQSDYSRPKIISIGPSYYKNPAFQAMETQKLKFLLRNGYRVPQLLAFKAEMKSLEKRARECYFEDFKDIPSDDFTWMMVLDGCFIVVLLRLNGRRHQGQLAGDPIFATRTMPFNIAHDLLLLENQLPLFVLEKLFELTRREDSTYNCLTSLAVQFFKPLRPGKDVVSTSTANSNSDINTAINNYHHLLALFHSTLAPENSRPSSTTQRERSNIIRNHRLSGGRSVPTATNLKSVGLTFRRSSGNLMEFRRWCFGGILEVPTFFLDKHTACVFRNLVAYEQHYRSATQWFTSLAIFYNSLLQTIEDVEILKSSGILRLDLMGESDEEVVNFFASVTKGLVFDVDRSCLLPLIKQINQYSHSFVAEFNHVLREQSGTAIFRVLVGSISGLVIYRLWPSLSPFSCM